MKALFQFIVFMPLLDLSNFFYWPTYICHNAWWVGDAKRWLHVIDRSLIPFVFEGRKTVTSSSQEASPSFDSITWGSRVSGADSLTHYPVLEQWHTSLKILFIYWISKHPSVYWNTVKSVSNTKQKHNFPLNWSLFFLDWQIHIKKKKSFFYIYFCQFCGKTLLVEVQGSGVQVIFSLTQAAFGLQLFAQTIRCWTSPAERDILVIVQKWLFSLPSDVCFPQQSSIHLLAVLMVLLWFFWSLKT